MIAPWFDRNLLQLLNCSLIASVAKSLVLARLPRGDVITMASVCVLVHAAEAREPDCAGPRKRTSVKLGETLPVRPTMN